MKYGILGANGFLGQNLQALLAQSHIPFAGASRRTGVDATSSTAVANWIIDNQLTHVINLAAHCGGIGLNQQQPATLWLNTTQITAAVLEAARLTNLEKLCMIGSVCSYAKNCPTPFCEEDLMYHGFPEATNAAYGVAKLNGFFGSTAYRREHGLNIIYLLPVNLYGPFDNFDLQTSHVIPALIRKCLAATYLKLPTVACWGTGTATREFLYVADAALGIHKAMCQYNGAEPINLGSGQEISIADLAKLIAQHCQFKGTFVWNQQLDGQPRRCLNTTKAKGYFDFTATTSLDDGIAQTVRWCEQNLTFQ